jgi:hypothetical protein
MSGEHLAVVGVLVWCVLLILNGEVNRHRRMERWNRLLDESLKEKPPPEEWRP